MILVVDGTSTTGLIWSFGCDTIANSSQRVEFLNVTHDMHLPNVIINRGDEHAVMDRNLGD